MIMIIHRAVSGRQPWAAWTAADRFSDAAAMLNWGFCQPPARLRLASAPAGRLAAGTEPGS